MVLDLKKGFFPKYNIPTTLRSVLGMLYFESVAGATEELEYRILDDFSYFAAF